LKFTNSDLMSFQLCQRAQGGRFDIAFGIDGTLLAAAVLGLAEQWAAATASPHPSISKSLLSWRPEISKQPANISSARYNSSDFLASTGYMAAAREVMGMLGAPVGPPRLPNTALDETARQALRSKLQQLGFFDWIHCSPASP
jgi:N-acetylneuraminate lyase